LNRLRDLPSVDSLLQALATGLATAPVAGMTATYGRPLTLQALRQALDEARERIIAGGQTPGVDELLESAQRTLQRWTTPTLLPVINAAGVILHTNLGRAPLSQAAMQAVHETALGYSTLEYDLEKGQRGSRLLHAETLLTRLTGAQAALVANNNAAGVLLTLSALARRRGVVIARTQLVEIGGGFRVPEVMQQSGARLVEIGATNRVHLSDYQQALEEKPALFLHAHRSNFRIVGFTSEPELAEIAGVAHQAGLPLVDDLGSGALLDTAGYGLGHEPTVGESLAAGADLVCFSGDKLLGGPQAGIVLGRADLIARLKKHPLMRAVRADKLCLAALSATLLHYLKDEAPLQVPVWRMLAARPDELGQRASRWADTLGQGQVISGQSTVGGGSLPGETLPTCLLALQTPSPNRFLAQLRRARPPIIARLQDDLVVLDPRSVLPEQEQALLSSLAEILAGAGSRS
jgi:L-seryl-tRNA(Ser) seleniumtransferase